MTFSCLYFRKMGTKQRYLMFFSYIGSAFRGSQIQFDKNPEIETVQGVLEKAFKHVFQSEEERPFCVHLASRTDTGVHALRAALSVDLPVCQNRYFSKPECLKVLMNSYFKNKWDIRILEVYAVPNTFKIFGSSLDKTYLYRVGILKNEFYDKSLKNEIPVSEIGRSELINFRSPNIFDFNKTEEATSLFEGIKDFGAIIGKPSKNTRSTICNIMSYTVERALPFIQVDPIAQKYDFYHFTCKGDRFLLHMVRRMVTLTLSVGFNTVTLAEIKKLFDEPVPSSWPRRATTQISGSGLYLVNVNIDLEKLNQNPETTNCS